MALILVWKTNKNKIVCSISPNEVPISPDRPCVFYFHTYFSRPNTTLWHGRVLLGKAGIRRTLLKYWKIDYFQNLIFGMEMFNLM